MATAVAPEIQPADFAQIFRTTEETTKPEVGRVIGTLPSWLSGTYLRVGPGRYDFENDFTVNHVFDGYSVITKFNISSDKVTLEKKYLETEVYKKVVRAQRPVICEFGTKGYSDPGKSMFSRLIPNLIPDLTDNCNMGLYQLGSSLIAGCETCHFHEVGPSNLSIATKFDASKLFFGTNTWTCHPLKDPETGITYNIGASILTGIKYNVIQIPPDTDACTPAKDLLKRSKVLCSFPSSWYGCFSFSHSFGMTKKYLVFIEQPYVLLASKILAAVVTKGHCFQDWLEWRPELKNNFWLIEKATGKVHKVRYQSEDPFLFLHIINCYEDAGNVVVDLITFPSTFALERMTMEFLRKGASPPVSEQPKGQRFVLPLFKNYDQASEQQAYASSSNLITTLKTKATAVLQKDPRNISNRVIIVTPEPVTLEGMELPSFNQAYRGRKYKYYYATGSAMAGNFENAVCKVNLDTKEVILWKDTTLHSLAPSCPSSDYGYSYLGEPIFVARPKSVSNTHTRTSRESVMSVDLNEDDGEEDDGVILCPATTAPKLGEPRTCKDFLVCLDAKSFTELGRINFESHIPQGLHGIFLPS